MRASDSRFARYAHIIIPPHTHTPHTQRRRVTGVACVAVVLICPLHGAGNSGVASWHWLAAHVVSMRTRRVRSLSAIPCLPAGGLICILRGVPSCTRLSVDPSNGAGCHGSKESPSLKLIADQVVHAAQRQSPSTLGPFGGNSMALVRRMSSSLRSAWSPSRQCSSAEQSPSASHKTMMSHESK